MTPSPWRAWWYLIQLSFLRQARLRQMVWVALGLLTFAAVFVAINTALDGWHIRYARFGGRQSVGRLTDSLEVAMYAIPRPVAMTPAEPGVLAAFQRVMREPPWPFVVFTQGIVMGLFLGFLLPLWTLSFATEALGGEREQGNLKWLLARPLPREAIYLAKFVATLPWVLGFNLGGFVLLCLLAGAPGRQALALFWPMVLLASIAFTALFHLLAAAFRRPTILALLYVFFLEIILNLMPGYLKYATIGFYTRCMMLQVAEPYGLPQPRADLFVPVSASTAMIVLISATVALLALGIWIFRRAEYQDTAA